MAVVDWSQLYQHRYSVAQRYGSIWQVPLAKRYSDVLFSCTEQHDALLEIGAGGRGLQKKIEKCWPSCEYKSFDIDRSQYHDFYDLEDITGQYDVICLFEVIEHVQPELALDILTKAYEHLRPGGKLVVSTPNVFYPPGYLRDATHITPWCYDELGGITLQAGFQLTAVYRLYKESIAKTLLRRYLGYPLFRLVRIDFAKQIIVVSEKPVG